MNEKVKFDKFSYDSSLVLMTTKEKVFIYNSQNGSVVNSFSKKIIGKDEQYSSFIISKIGLLCIKKGLIHVFEINDDFSKGPLEKNRFERDQILNDYKSSFDGTLIYSGNHFIYLEENFKLLNIEKESKCQETYCLTKNNQLVFCKTSIGTYILYDLFSQKIVSRIDLQTGVGGGYFVNDDKFLIIEGNFFDRIIIFDLKTSKIIHNCYVEDDIYQHIIHKQGELKVFSRIKSKSEGKIYLKISGLKSFLDIREKIFPEPQNNFSYNTYEILYKRKKDIYSMDIFKKQIKRIDQSKFREYTFHKILFNSIFSKNSQMIALTTENEVVKYDLSKSELKKIEIVEIIDKEMVSFSPDLNLLV